LCHDSFPPVDLINDDFNGKVRAAQFALHALDAGFQILDHGLRALHLKNLRRAKLDTDVTSLAVLLVDFDFWQCFLHQMLLHFPEVKGKKYFFLIYSGEGHFRPSPEHYIQVIAGCQQAP
jgi:hypothetical protein